MEWVFRRHSDAQGNNNYNYYLLQLSFHPVAVELTLVQTQQIRINMHKRNSTKTRYKQYKTSKYKYTYYHNTHAVVKTPPHTLTHTLQNKLKQPQYKIHTKWNSHNTVKYPQYKVTPPCVVLLSPRTFTVTQFTSLRNKITSHESRQFTPHHYTSHRVTYLHSVPTKNKSEIQFPQLFSLS